MQSLRWNQGDELKEKGKKKPFRDVMMCNKKCLRLDHCSIVYFCALFFLRLTLLCTWWRRYFIALFLYCLFAALPQHDPKIEGVEKNYYQGDFLFGNCTSDFSFPPPTLAWYINEQKADSNLLQPFQESTIEAYGFKLHQRSLEIRFRIDKKINPFITDGKVHMKCVAQIRKMPSQIRESNHIFYVSSLDDLKNQKLINWKNSGKYFSHFLGFVLNW